MGGWAAVDRYMWPMPVRTRTARLVATAEPTALNGVGFTVTDTEAGGAAVIAVETSAFTGKVFQVSQQRHDADKRAHLLAYLLEQFAGVSTTSPAPSVPAVAAPSPGAATGDSSFDTALQRLRAQLAGGQYEAALGTLDGLRTAVANRARTDSVAGGK